MKRIVIGADHRGVALKNFLLEQRVIGDHVVQWLDVGTTNVERTDYPLYAFKAVKKLQAHEADYGVLICASGVGMSIAANRFKHIYAALAWCEDVARHARLHDNANILVLPAAYVTNEEARAMVGVWLQTEFLGGHYATRLRDLDQFD
jgi:ribose 5-phosphate isomerase B